MQAAINAASGLDAATFARRKSCLRENKISADKMQLVGGCRCFGREIGQLVGALMAEEAWDALDECIGIAVVSAHAEVGLRKEKCRF